MKFGVCYNAKNARALRIADHAVEFLRGHDVETVYVDNAPVNEPVIPLEEVDLAGVDTLVCIGGDGTMLRAMQGYKGPIFGVNAGVLGFLTEASGDDIEASLERILRGDILIDSRMKLMTLFGERRLPDAVNEVVLHTDQVAKMREFDLSIRGEHVGRVRADGVMVATPTGSTSYALSAGGPIIHPGMDAMVVVSLAPFSLTVKPTVLPGESTIDITPVEKDCVLVVDGQVSVAVPKNECVHISRSQVRARFIRFRPVFFPRLSRRLFQE